MRRDRRKPAGRARRRRRLRGKLEQAGQRPQAHWIRTRWSNGGNRFWRRREPWRLLRNGLPGSRRRFPLWTRMRFHAAKFSAGARLWSKNDWPRCRSSLKNKEPSFWRCRKTLGGLGCTRRFTTRSGSGNLVSLRQPCHSERSEECLSARRRAQQIPRSLGMTKPNRLYQLHLARLDRDDPHALHATVGRFQHFEPQALFLNDFALLRNASG